MNAAGAAEKLLVFFADVNRRLCWQARYLQQCYQLVEVGMTDYLLVLPYEEEEFCHLYQLLYHVPILPGYLKYEVDFHASDNPDYKAHAMQMKLAKGFV